MPMLFLRLARCERLSRADVRLQLRRFHALGLAVP